MVAKFEAPQSAEGEPGEAPGRDWRAHAPGSRERRYRVTRRVTLVGVVINSVLAVVKIAGGWLAQSQALLADGLHSAADLITDAVVLVAARLSKAPSDAEHPYGHGRIETVATVGLGLLLTATAAGLAWDAIARLFAPAALLAPAPIALAIAALSIVLKEGLFQYTERAARRIRSAMLRANAWHHRGDAVSSLVVVVGIAGTLAGLEYLDAVAAVLVAAMIARMGLVQIWSSVQELIDTAIDAGRLEALRQVIRGVDGVRSMHMLRTRGMGGQILADVHIQVDPRISVSEGHQVAETVQSTLIRRFEEISDVVVHIDPEDDEHQVRTRGLPLRGALLERIRPHIAGLPYDEALQGITLHYLDGRIDMELVFDGGQLPAVALGELAPAYGAALDGQLPELGEVTVLLAATARHREGTP